MVFVKKQETHTRNIPQKECNSFIDKNKLDMEIPSREQVIESGDESMSETEGVTTTEPLRGNACDLDWVPGSLHLQRKLRSDNATDGIAYRLRSRGVSRSEPEPGSDNAQSLTSLDKARPTSSLLHSLFRASL